MYWSNNLKNWLKKGMSLELTTLFYIRPKKYVWFPIDPSDLPSNIADFKFISKTGKNFFLKDKIFQISI